MSRSQRSETVQTAVRLPREMHDRLKQSDAGVSEEIRQRVERTFAEDDAADAKTRELAADIIALANEIHGLAGSAWHQHEDVHRALVEAVVVWLEGICPEMESMAVKDLLGFWTTDDPATIGRTIARQRLAKRERARNMGQLAKHARKGTTDEQ